MFGTTHAPASTGQRISTPDELTTIGERIKWRRKIIGLSQQMLAREIGISQAAISAIEGAKSEDRAGGGTSYVVKIARALKCSAEWLEGGIGHITEASAPIFRVPVI